jgi:hypothetical protein
MAGALALRAARPAEPNASSVRKSCLYVVPRGLPVAQGVPVAQGFPPSPGLRRVSPKLARFTRAAADSPVLPAQEHCLTSDVTRARATGATLLTADRILADRAEGRLLVCAQDEGGWFAVSKVPLTLHASQGKDALLIDLPPGVIDLLRVVCPELLVILRDE